MVEGREIRLWSDSRSGTDKRRDDDRRNATPVHVEVKAVGYFGEEILDRRDVWTRRNCLLRNGRRNDVIVHPAVLVGAVLKHDYDKVCDWRIACGRHNTSLLSVENLETLIIEASRMSEAARSVM